jgi:hypothetical protein
MVELERRKIVGPANPANGYKREILQNTDLEKPHDHAHP